jgi:hypothetical protein
MADWASRAVRSGEAEIDEEGPSRWTALRLWSGCYCISVQKSKHRGTEGTEVSLRHLPRSRSKAPKFNMKGTNSTKAQPNSHQEFVFVFFAFFVFFVLKLETGERLRGKPRSDIDYEATGLGRSPLCPLCLCVS